MKISKKHEIASYLADKITVYDNDFIMITDIYDLLVEFEKTKGHK